MDPFTLLIIAAIGWAIRNVAEDAWAFARREPSPRIVRQRERQRLAQERVAATGHPGVGQAIVGRVATRIADRPESSFLRPLREFLAERWADALADAVDKHRQRRDERNDRTNTSRTKPLIAEPCAGGCGRYVVRPTKRCPACARGKSQRDPQPEPARGELDTRLCRGGCGLLLAEPWELCPDCERAQQDDQRSDESVVLGRCTRCHRLGDTFDDLGECPECHLVTEEMLDNEDHVDDEASRSRGRTDQRRRFPPMPRRQSWPCGNGCGRPVSTPDAWCSVCVAGLPPQFPDDPEPPTDQPDQSDQPDQNATTETPEPDPAPDTTRKDPHPVSTPTEINGDVNDPLTALAFATGCLDLNAAIMNELDVMANNLEGEGVGGDCISIIRGAQAAAEQFGTAALRARDEFARHVATQADIAGNTDLRDTVRGTYLDTARA